MAIVLIVLLVVVTLVGGTILAGHFAFSITPKPSKQTPRDLGLNHRDVYFQNRHGTVLHGWWIPSDDASRDNPLPTVVMIHGWSRNCQRMLPYIRAIQSLPLNILVFEGRGHGENAKESFISQVGIADDINAAVDWLVLRPEVQLEKIGVIGHSLGAAATILETSRDKRISAFVADGSYANPLEVILGMMKEAHVPYIPFGWLMKHYIQLRLNTTFHKVAPQTVISKITVPGLLIHGDKDTVVPVEDSQRNLEHAPENIQLWIAEGCGHSDTYTHPEFATILRTFLKNALLNRPVAFFHGQSSGSVISDLN